MILEDKWYHYADGKKHFEKWVESLKLNSDGESKDILIYLELYEEQVNETKKKLEDYEKLIKHFDRLLPHRSSMNDVYG
jgi:hypothetical protein